MKILRAGKKGPSVSRRGLLIGGGAGLGLTLCWSLWPRHYLPNLSVRPGESLFGGHLKIASPGRVTIVAPEAEMGQGSYTLFAQILADELGADWQMIGLEAAPVNPLYGLDRPPPDWPELADTKSMRLGPTPPLQITTEAFAPAMVLDRARDAGAAARILLCKAAARRWGADWRACDTAEGFVLLGNDRISFGVLAEAAAREQIPQTLPWRTKGTHRLIGKSVPRLDTPAKVDGSVNFTADVRLPLMVFAALRHTDAPPTQAQRAAIKTQSDVLGLIVEKGWIAAIGQSWWAANRALNSVFQSNRAHEDRAAHTAAVSAAFTRPGKTFGARGDVASAFDGAPLFRATYHVDPVQHGALEPLSATAVLRDGKLEIWAPTQSPGLAQQKAAKAAGLAIEDVIVHPMQIGGSFGRMYEQDPIAQAAVLAVRLRRPVQLCWSRQEDSRHDPAAPPAQARMIARLDPDGQLMALRARIAAPAARFETKLRLIDDLSAADALDASRQAFDAGSISGAFPPYAIPHISIDHHPADLDRPSGKIRGGADRYTAFFREAFIDELAAQSGTDPFSFRMRMLEGAPRLAACLERVTQLGAWEGGGPGTQQGIACHVMHDSAIAVLAEAYLNGSGRLVVSKIYAAADVGQILHSDIARQQIEGGLMFGLAMATGAHRIGALDLLGKDALGRMADCPDIHIDLIGSSAPSGALGEIGIPAIAPAVANALWTGSGRRIRALPLTAEG